MRESFCGIDVGEKLLFAADVMVEGEKVIDINFCEDRGIAEVLSWVAHKSPSAVAIDSPPGPNRQLLADPRRRSALGIEVEPRNVNRRVAEYRLGIGGYYSTPDSFEAAPGW